MAASTLDSGAVFEQRATTFGLGAAQIAAFKAAGITSLAKLAFATGFHPGSADDTMFVVFVETVLGGEQTPGIMSSVRRLHFEAYTLCAAELKQRLDQTDESAPKRLPVAERAARRQEQKTRLVGLCLDNELDIADCLVDACVHQHDQNQLRWLPWEQCVTKEAEMSSHKKEASLRTDASGHIRLADASTPVTTKLTTDLRARLALQRRALAYDQANLISYMVCEAWHSRMFSTMLRSPPEGFRGVTVEQLIRADQMLFSIMGNITRNNIQPAADGVKPLDAALQTAMNDAQVTFLLLPLPAGGSAHAPGSGFGKRKASPPKDSVSSSSGRPSKKAKGAGKAGKTRPGNTASRMPSELQGMRSKNSKGQPICYNCNLGRRTGDVSNGRCSRGMHQCCKPNCYESHPYSSCPKA